MAKKSIRFLSLFLVLVMAVSALMSCKQGPAETTGTETESKTETSTDAPKPPDDPSDALAEIAKMLSGSMYANPDYAGRAEFGLSDIGNVGVVESEVKELYPVPADSEYGEGCVIPVD